MIEMRHPPPERNFDSKGCCVKHPRIQLRRRSPMNVLGWQVVRSKCPLCDCNFPEKSGSKTRDDNHVEQATQALKTAKPSSPSSGINVTSTSLKHQKGSSSSLNTLQTSETGYSTSSSTNLNVSVNKVISRKASQESFNSMSSMSSLDTTSSVHEVVCGMPYSYYFPDDDIYLDGFYTGQIDATTGLPHGMGTWRSSDGRYFMEGDWNAGRLYVKHPDRVASQTTSMRSSGTRHRRSSTLNSSQRRCSLERIAEYDLGRSDGKDAARSTSSTETSRGRATVVVGKVDFQGPTSSVSSGRRSRSESRNGRYRRPANSEEDFCQSDTALLDSARRHRPRHGSFDLEIEDDLNDSFQSVASILRPPRLGSSDVSKSDCADMTIASKVVRFDLMLNRKSSITLDDIDCDNSVAMDSCYRAQEVKDCEACDMNQLEKVLKNVSFSVDPPGLGSSMVMTRKQTHSLAA
mmetsp:Transcript_21506/g.50561  ORF Transcript_21506/g.50561 Transcript_21506/m.50561 type:complete len:462 (-) Transcript_21506:314-1699(-)